MASRGSLYRVTLIAASIGLSAANTGAWAQTGTGAADNASSSTSANSAEQLGEVVVTATRVATEVEKTPVAINVYSGADLLQQSVHTLNALQNIDPSINITEQDGPYIAIRGVTSSNTTEVGQPSVSIAHDGFFVNRTISMDMAMYDLQRLEIDKGPQGTLFGRNSDAGVINIISAAPVLGRIAGYVNANFGNYSMYDGEGAVSLPIGNTLAVRISLFDHARSGYIHQVGPGINYWADDDRSQSGRVQLLWRPSDVFDAVVRFQRDHMNEYGHTAALVVAGQPFDPATAASSVPGYEFNYNKINESRVTWEFNVHHLPLDSTLTYQGGYDRQYWLQPGDTSAPPLPPSQPLPQLSTFTLHDRVQTWNHEIRVATPQDRPVFAQFGVFYFSEFNFPLNAIGTQYSPPFAGLNNVEFHYRVETTSHAAFGQFGFNLPANLQLTAGYRYTRDSVGRSGYNIQNCVINGVPPAQWASLGCVGTPPLVLLTTQAGASAITESKATYHIGLQWQATPDKMVYAKYDTGYEDGGFNTAASLAAVSYGPEIVEALEVGSKNYFLNRRLLINADVFDQNYIGYQASIPLLNIIPTPIGTANFGGARIYGAEVQVNALLSPQDRFDLNSTFLRARFEGGLPPVANFDGSCCVDVSGHELPNAPPAVIIAGYEHDLDIGSNKLTLRLQAKYSDRFYFDIYQNPDTGSATYVIGDVDLTWTPANPHWNVQAYVHNILDKYTISNAALTPTTTPTGSILLVGYDFNPPRTFGVQGTYKF